MANGMIAKYESAFGSVTLDADTVKQYLVKGNSSVSDQEVFLFIKMCEAQKLNPFASGEVYLIKFGNTPAQMVVGYDTYKRRAEENPQYLYKESGIIVCRGEKGEIVQKKGACLYPSETLIGGWCKVHKMKDGNAVETYKEVSFSEYNKGNAIWKEKPCTMIEKVAISQCLREAFPKDYEGLYTEAELSPTYNEVDDDPTDQSDSDEIITQSERKHLFERAQTAFGREKGNEIIKNLLQGEGIESTAQLKRTVYDRINNTLDDLIAAEEAANAAEE